LSASPPPDEPAPIRILDAGCGRDAHELELELAGARHVVGIDISAAALAENPDLDERIVGDLETYPLPPDTFDLAVCWDVLEHLRRPDLALDNLTRSLKPGGRLVLGLPNVLTPKALATKFTPHRFHVLVYRRVFDFPNAGRPGYGPFPTYLRWCLRPDAIAAYAARRGLLVDELERSVSESMTPIYDRHPVVTALLVRAWTLLFGADPRDSELRIVLRRPAEG
jgi:SAM-dependent methyltransferase